ncbi:MAG: MlaD family protein [Rhodocyclaceae bacterium]|nr:MlaD family protein [Rhodocyclaceae bacterium]
MKRDNINYLAVGCFVLAMAAALLYGLYRVTGQSGKGDAYVTHFANVAGIKVGSVVTYEGFDVGNVAGIEPVLSDGRTRYRVALNMRKSVRIPEDSRAMIAAPGLLSAPLVEIREGASPTALAVGGEIKGVSGGNLMESVAQLAGQLSELTETTIRPMLAQIGKRVDSLGGSMEKNLPPALEDLRATMARLNATAGRVETLFNEENQKRWQSLLGNADEASASALKLSRELHSVTKEVNELVRDSRGVVSGTGRELESSLRRADSVLYQLESAGRHLNEFSRQIRENPSSLISSRPPAEASGDEK